MTAMAFCPTSPLQMEMVLSSTRAAVKPFEEILLKMKREQEENKRLCGRCYCQDYIDYIYVNQIGEIVKPGFVTAHFSAVLNANNHLPHIRFHDLRHNVARSLTSSQYEFIERYTHLDENSKINSANAIIGILEQKKDTQSI